MRVSNENEWSSPDAYQITLVSVTFSVKFPCRMSVEMGGTTLTREITASNNNVYRFDQDITLRKEGN